MRCKCCNIADAQTYSRGEYFCRTCWSIARRAAQDFTLKDLEEMFLGQSEEQYEELLKELGIENTPTLS